MNPSNKEMQTILKDKIVEFLNKNGGSAQTNSAYYEEIASLCGLDDIHGWGTDPKAKTPNVIRQHLYALRKLVKSGVVQLDGHGKNKIITLLSNQDVKTMNQTTATVKQHKDNTKTTQHPILQDTYLLKIAMQQTPCSEGYYSSRSDKCHSCYLQTICRNNMYALEEAFAEELRAFNGLPAKVANPKPKKVQIGNGKYTLEMAKSAEQFPTPAGISLPCGCCGQTMTPGEPGWWVPGKTTNVIYCDPCHQSVLNG